MTTAAPPETVGPLVRGITVLRAATAAGGVAGLGDLARTTGLARSTVDRIAATLERIGYVRLDGTSLALAPRLMELGNAFLAALRLPAPLGPLAERLAEDLGEPVSLAVPDGDGVRVVHQSAGRRAVSLAFRIGDLLPAERAAAGAVFAAHWTDEQWAAWRARRAADPDGHGFPAVPPRAGEVGADLPERATRARADGWAPDDQLVAPGLVALALPVRGPGGTAVCALSVAGHTSRYTAPDLARALLPRAREAVAAMEATLRSADRPAGASAGAGVGARADRVPPATASAAGPAAASAGHGFPATPATASADTASADTASAAAGSVGPPSPSPATASAGPGSGAAASAGPGFPATPATPATASAGTGSPATASADTASGGTGSAAAGSVGPPSPSPATASAGPGFGAAASAGPGFPATPATASAAAASAGTGSAAAGSVGPPSPATAASPGRPADPGPAATAAAGPPREPADVLPPDPARTPKQELGADFVESLARGLSVITAFGEDAPELTLSGVARATGLARATARRALITLEHLGCVTVRDGLFRLTPAVLGLGCPALSRISLADIAAPHLADLTADVHDSASLAVLDGADIRYTARVATTRIMSVRIAVGTRFPAYATAMGRVLLAGLPAADRAEFLARTELRALTARTVTAPARLAALLDRAWEKGFALVEGELEEGLRSIAVPVRDGGGRTVAAVNVAMHTGRRTTEACLAEVLPRLRTAAGRIETELRIAGRFTAVDLGPAGPV